MRTIVTREYVNEEYGHGYEIEYRGDTGWFSDLWEIFVLDGPDNPYDKDPAKCHLYSSGQVCIKAGREPRDFDTAEAVALYFMERYSEYCETGEFRDDGDSVEV